MIILYWRNRRGTTSALPPQDPPSRKSLPMMERALSSRAPAATDLFGNQNGNTRVPFHPISYVRICTLAIDGHADGPPAVGDGGSLIAHPHGRLLYYEIIILSQHLG